MIIIPCPLLPDSKCSPGTQGAPNSWGGPSSCGAPGRHRVFGGPGVSGSHGDSPNSVACGGCRDAGMRGCGDAGDVVRGVRRLPRLTMAWAVVAFAMSDISEWTCLACRIRNYLVHSRRSDTFAKFSRAH